MNRALKKEINKKIKQSADEYVQDLFKRVDNFLKSDFQGLAPFIAEEKKKRKTK